MRLDLYASIALSVGLASAPAVEAGSLIDAAEAGDYEQVQRLLHQGASVEEIDGEGKTALYYSARLNRVEIAELLIEQGADPDRLAVGLQGPTDGPIHVAAERGHLDMIRILAVAGADITRATTFSPVPLHMAIKRKQDEAAALLTELGADNFRAPDVSHLISSSGLRAGEALVKGCNRCHAISKGGEPTGGYGSVFGPTLWDIVGRQKAGVAGWGYSEAMAGQVGIWNFRELNNFLANPTATVPGTKMDFVFVESLEQRAAILAYLRMLSDQPMPLP